MIDYDFSTLNDKEFENISIELISKDQGKKFERFKPGKDAGVDGRFFADDGKEEIIQCKHYLKTGYKGLITKLKSEEKEKVVKLNPKKYLFITSLPLSRKEKQEIKEIFDPYIEKDNDIYGQEDLNDLIKNNPDIEEHHYKLWLSSTLVLKRILNNAIKGRSEFLLEDIEAKTKLYVMTKNHQEALKRLNESHTIIIAGEPGIGKTTLAENLALMYVEKGFEFCVIENSLNEAEDIFDPEKKQLYYFDDFLGSNYLEALEFQQDSHIVKFIGRVKKDKNKRFILTSRTNVFNQSLMLSDKFVSNKIDKEQFVIKVDDLKEIEKAKILYNHIWHSDLGEKYIDELYKEKRYKDVIKHKNFNPRLVEFITDIDHLESVSTEDYWEFVIKKLDNPAEIWNQTFDHGSDDYMRNLVILTVFNGNKIEENELIHAYSSMNRRIKLQNYSYASKDFNSVIKSVVKYFLNRAKTYKKTIEYSLFNPSIADFIINRYKHDDQQIMQVFLSLQTLESLNVLSSLDLNKIISKQLFQRIIMRLYEELDINVLPNIKKSDYAIQLFWLFELEGFNMSYDKNKKIAFFQRIFYEPTPFTQLNEFFDVLTSLLEKEEISINNYHFLKSIIENIDDDINEINQIIKFLKHFKIDDEEIIEALNELVQQYLIYELDGSMAVLDIDDVDFDHDNEGDVYLSDSLQLNKHMKRFLTDLISEIDEFEELRIDEYLIKNQIDTSSLEETLINAYYESFGEDENYERQEVNYTNDIDDLFER